MPAKIKVGDKFNTSSCGQVVVVDYQNCHNIIIRFDDGTEVSVESANLRNGQVRNKNQPSVHGVGFLSYGPFVGYRNNKQTPEYRAWIAMMDRCYGNRAANPAYEGCIVHQDWHNFQTFAAWYTTHKNYNKGFELDKDLSVFGNKQYGPEYCDLIPREVNLSLMDSGASARDASGLPIGVGVTQAGRYYVQHGTGLGNERKWKGTYESKELAVNAYNQAKVKRVKFLAEKHKDVLGDKIYKNLSEYNI